MYRGHRFGFRTDDVTYKLNKAPSLPHLAGALKVRGDVVSQRLESLTEKYIREAIEKGEFDNLPGNGQPLDLSENHFEDPDLRTVHRLLRNAGFAPAWIEERKDIEAQFQVARTNLARAWRIYRPEGTSPNPDAWERNVAEFRARIAELRQRVHVYNLKAPATIFHKRQLDADALVEEIKMGNTPEHKEAQR